MKKNTKRDIDDLFAALAGYIDFLRAKPIPEWRGSVRPHPLPEYISRLSQGAMITGGIVTYPPMLLKLIDLTPPRIIGMFPVIHPPYAFDSSIFMEVDFCFTNSDDSDAPVDFCVNPLEWECITRDISEHPIIHPLVKLGSSLDGSYEHSNSVWAASESAKAPTLTMHLSSGTLMVLAVYDISYAAHIAVKAGSPALPPSFVVVGESGGNPNNGQAYEVPPYALPRTLPRQSGSGSVDAGWDWIVNLN